MVIQDIMKLGFSDMRSELTKKESKDIDKFRKQFDTRTHDVFDATIRKKKEVRKKNESGGTDTSFNEVSRLAVPFQKLICDRAASFLIGNGVKVASNADSDSQNTVVEMIKKLWSDNKLDYKTKKLARLTFSETEAAELWYLVEDPGIWNWLKKVSGLGNVKYKLRVKLLAKSLGDILYPHFTDDGDMDAFSREFILMDGQKKVNHFEVYTADFTYKYIEADGGWTPNGSPVKNPIGKIPIVYYSQDFPDWWDVQPLIERYETLISNFADTNDYFAAPMVKVKGTVSGFADKGEQGKVITLTGEGADASYLTWEQGPEAIKLELENLENLIYSCSQTPNISFSQMKGIGNLSGIALKLMFLDANLKALNKQEVFGEALQRRLNILKAFIGEVIAVKFKTEIDLLEVWPEFKFYMPSNETEDIANLVLATGNKPIISQKTAVKLNPYVENPDEELANIKEDNVQDLGQSMV